MIPFHFDWPVCVNGYRVDDPKAKPPEGAVFTAGPGWRVPKERQSAPKRSGSLLLTGDTGARIVRSSSKLDYRPPLKDHHVCRELADCPKTPEGACGFVSRFGFLLKPKAPAEYLDDIYAAIDTAKDMVRLVNAKDWDALSYWLDVRAKDWPGGFGKLALTFAPPECPWLPGSFIGTSERPTLRLRPGNLFHAAVVQLLDEIGQPLRRCKRPGCPEYFTFGSGTGRRETARYCSTRCKDAHTYMKRKKESRS